MVRSLRVAEMRLRNKRRWDAHVSSRASEVAPLQTVGVLFNRSNLLQDGKYVGRKTTCYKIGHASQLSKQRCLNGNENMQNKETDSKTKMVKHIPMIRYGCSVDVASPRNYSIPPTSVVDKVSKIRVCYFFGYHLTAVHAFDFKPKFIQTRTPDIRPSKPGHRTEYIGDEL